MKLDEIAKRFQGVRRNGDGWEAICPCHDDNKPSLSIGKADNGGVLLYCQVGCATPAVVAAAGLKMADLMPSNGTPAKSGFNIAATYDYHDESNVLLYQAVRIEPKDFRQRSPKPGGGWEWKLNGAKRVLYRLPELLAADPTSIVFVCEGEKDVDRLRSMGLVATCNVGGASKSKEKNKWLPEYNESLRGRRVAVLVDNDEAGEAHSRSVAKSLRGIAVSVTLLYLPDLPPKGDVSDWLNSGGTKEKLLTLAEVTAEFSLREPGEDDEPFPGEPSSQYDSAPNGTAKEATAHLAIGDMTAPEWRTELSNAKRFAAMHGANVRYCPVMDKWFVFGGTHWQLDRGAIVESLAKDVAAEVWATVKEDLPTCERGDQMALLSFAKMTSSANGIAHTITLARSEEGLTIQPEQLDRDPWALNVANGTLDLRTGKKRAHNKADMLTKISPVVFAERFDCPTWRAFLERILPDEDVRKFMQRLVGYWLTGSVRDHVLPILYGVGANGKSVFLNTIMALLGDDYACQAAPDLLMAKQSSHPTELADLHGRRLVCSIESGEGRRLNEPLIKQLTGGDSIRCRRMREDFWSFKPSHKLATATNHRPRVQGTDLGMWRRMLLVPFGVTIPPAEQNKQLPEKLAKELPGILNWALAGCMEWQADGLNPPASVMAATEDYKRDEDGIQRFVDERCVVKASASAGATPMFEAYERWAKDSGESPVRQKTFGTRLNELGFTPDRDVSGRVIRYGIGLIDARRAEGSEPSEG